MVCKGTYIIYKKVFVFAWICLFPLGNMYVFYKTNIKNKTEKSDETVGFIKFIRFKHFQTFAKFIIYLYLCNKKIKYAL